MGPRLKVDGGAEKRNYPAWRGRALKENRYMEITVHVKGLNNARMPVLVELRNVASSYFVRIDNTSGVAAAMQFSMNNRKYDEGSVTAGTISTRISLHGTLTDRNSIAGHADKPIHLDMLFMLPDKAKTIVRRTADITQLIRFASTSNGSFLLTFSLALDAALPLLVN